MRKMLFVLILCAAVAAPASFAADQPINFHADGARVHSGFGDGGPLTLPSQAAAADVAQGFLAERHAGRTIDSLVVTDQFDRDGITHVRLGQQVDGLDVYGTYVKAAVNQFGELVHLIENLDTPPRGGLQPALIGPEDALAAAIGQNHPGRSSDLTVVGTSGNTTLFDTDGGFYWRPPTATLVAVPLQGPGMQQGFLVETWEDDSNLLYHTLVGRTGQVLGVQLRTNDDSYNIFPDHPENSTQTIVQGPGSGNTESPIGWLFPIDHRSIFISGNNTDTYLDTDTSNSPDPGGVTISDGNFVTVVDLTLEPEDPGNQEVAVQNLFYLCNVIHDKLYRHGFIESTGNFQDDNFGNGGAGGDPVLCEAQDGSGTDNANFSTPSDGSSGRMQMFVWTQTSPKRDGDLDSDIPWHEYGHGLTWRMIGSMSGPMSGAIGEGNSDVLSIWTNDNDVVGEYSFANPNGIRSEPYTGYSRTYGDFDGGSVHFDGEIYAAIMWDLKTRYETEGISLDTGWDDMVGGMNFTPAGPAFEDMRDGILAQADASRDCLIWESFAKFGVGVNAEGSVSGGGPFGGGNVNVTEDFSVPAECGCTITEDPEASCGDGVDNDCDGAVDSNDSDCDCTITEDPEVSCSDGVDNDCDGAVDSNDSDCDPGVCELGQKGDPCSVDDDCCSLKCRGPSGRMTCK